MSRRCNSCKQRIFLLILALQLILHVASSDDRPNPHWCGKVQNEANDVWSGQNFSKRFHLKDPILDPEILMWTKGNSVWVKRNVSPLEYTGDGHYSHTRYRMTKVSNVSFDLFIDYADQNDTGHHVVTLNLGEQSLCTALIMNLTVNTQKPVCSTRLNKSDGKLQMSCQWVHRNKGDRAHFEVESEVLDEHQVQEVNFNGIFIMTHTFTINVALDRVVDEITVPPRCVVSRGEKVRETCEFLEVRSYPLTYIQNKSVELKCCAPKPSKPLSLLYDCYGNELPITSTRNYTTKEDKCILFFLCDANEENNSNITVIKMGQSDEKLLVKYKGPILSVGGGELEHDNASEDQRCEVMTVEVTNFNWALNNEDGTSTDSDITRNCVSSQSTELVSGKTLTYNPGGITTKYPHILIAMAATAASVLVFITGACITKCYYLYNSSGKHYLVRRHTAGDPQRSPPEAEDDDVVRDIAMTTFISQTPKQDGDAGYQSLNFNQPLSDDEEHCFKEESTEPCSGPPSLPLGREMTKHETGGRPESVKKTSCQQNAPIACKPNKDITHCSVAMKIRDDWKGIRSPTQLHEMYGKSDMSHEFFQSGLLHDIFPPPPALTTNQAYHVYENAVASDTDESSSGDELYINTSVSALI